MVQEQFLTPKQITGPNAGGPRQFPFRTPLAARVGLALGKNSMLPIRSLGIVAALIGLSGCASNSGVRPMGANTYIVTRQAATGFSGAGTLKADAIGDAAKFCEAQGKVLKVVAVTEAQPPYIFGNFPKAEVVFKALSPGDPELARQSEYDSSGTQVRVGSSPVDRSEVKISVERQETADIYTKLEKLDELRKKGVLTEEEFQKEKTRLLGAAR